MNEIIRGKGALGRVNVNVVKVQNNKSRMLEERVIGSRRKLPAEANNGEVLFLFFTATSYFIYYGTRLPVLDPLQGLLKWNVVRIRLVVYGLEYRYLHCLWQS